MRKKNIFILAGAIVSAVVTYQQSGANDKKSGHNTDRGSNNNHGSNNDRGNNDDYRKALRILWTDVYPNSGETLYCGQHFSTKNRQERKKYVNAEHVFPMSWVTKDLKCGTRKECQRKSKEFRKIESDLHNIYPALIKLNKARSNFRFGNVAGEKRQFGNCDFEVNQRGRVAEPKEQVRGDVARSMLYMAYQYNLSLHTKTEKLMREWDRKDPPSAEEKRRELIIHKIQGRENPYISRYPFKK